MAKRFIASRFIVTFGMLLALSYIARSPASTAAAMPITQAKQELGAQRSLHYQPNHLPSDGAPTSIYLSVVLDDWLPPCGSIPVLIEPADGSLVTLNTVFKFDGRGPEPIYNWVELDFNTNQDFTGTGLSYYLQPASLWEKTLGELVDETVLTPGIWYWRTSLWCNGPGWPPPSVGYDHSPYTEVWSFTLED